jgi:hypothetical protein
MRRSTLFRVLGLFVLAATASIAPVAATTDTCPCADSRTTIGTITSGSYVSTCTGDDSVFEWLQEGTSGGVSHLEHVWKICNVPAGTQSIVLEGIRAANSDGDNFQFYYNLGCDSATSLYQPITNAIVNKNFYLSGGLVYSMNVTTTATTDIYILVKDTAGGSNLDTLKMDYLAVRTSP